MMNDQDIPDYIVLTQKTIKSARKEHKCSYCGNLIEMGKRYYLHVYLIDGVFTLDKVHPTCYYGGPE